MHRGCIVVPLKGTTMHPRCRHIGACWDLLECWFQLFSTSQNTNQIQFRTFLKKKKSNFWFPCWSTREELSVDVSITNVELMLTKPVRFLFSAYGNSGYGQNSISNFFEKIQIFRLSSCSTLEDLSIYVSFTNVRLILTKPGWFLFSGYGQTDGQTDRRTDRQTDRQTDGRTDRRGFGIIVWKHVGTQKI